MNIWEFFFQLGFFQWVGVIILTTIAMIGIASIGPFVIIRHHYEKKDG